MTVAEFWPQCLLILKQRLSSQQFQMWIAPLTIVENTQDGQWVVLARNAFTFNYVRDRFWSLIVETATKLAGENTAAQLVLRIGQGQSIQATHSNKTAATPSTAAIQPAPPQPQLGNDAEVGPSVKPTDPLITEQPSRSKKESAQDIIAKRLHDHNHPAANNTIAATATAQTTNEAAKQSMHNPALPDGEIKQQQRYKDTNLNPEHTFATLVQGKGNRMAHAAALSIAETPGNSMYNPFFVYGSTGLGKTHLVQAIGNQLFQSNKKARIRYIHADEFIRGIMNAFRAKSFDAMRQQYQQVDLLILDDVQFIADKERTMEEFFYVYNHLIDGKKQVILTCDRLPSHIDGMDDRLKSRFSWGLTLELEPPELEMRVAILQKKAELAHVELEEDAAFFIAKHIRSNVRELEGAFKRVAAQSKFAKRRIDVGLATEALQDILAVNHKPMTLEHIQNTVSKFYGITISDMMSKKRTRNLARPRQMAMTLAKELTNLSLPAIGSGFGGRDHTTVMHAVKSIGKLRKDDAETAKAYDTLIMILRD
ncbi:chromosomal replication initiator protein DnaA [Snodgrassella sp. CFCC 13594]|uniref:chromosomal replication initiator protein DnaA n=1 Tax=Snodgrassella sp. CFCC 13594 TaxID=1775559 RepID=UPI0008307AD1|nr:chromosomal replication initiator protein DnaA [Snodgrassella sp. CFCC 13594]